MRYVVVGYILTYGTLVGYVALLIARVRSAEKRVGDRP